jgi:hypothetical protein
MPVDLTCNWNRPRVQPQPALPVGLVRTRLNCAARAASVDLKKGGVFRISPIENQKPEFLGRRFKMGVGVALRGLRTAALAPSAPAAPRLLMRYSRAARSESRASARSQRCCGLQVRPQRPLAARPSSSAALAPSAPAGTCIGMRLSRAGQSKLARLLARKPWTPRAFRRSTFAQKLCSPWGRLILRRAQNSN